MKKKCVPNEIDREVACAMLEFLTKCDWNLDSGEEKSCENCEINGKGYETDDLDQDFCPYCGWKLIMNHDENIMKDLYNAYLKGKENDISIY